MHGSTMKVSLCIYFNLIEIHDPRSGLNYMLCTSFFVTIQLIVITYWIYTVRQKKRENMPSDLNRKLSATNTLILHCPALDSALSVARNEQVYRTQDQQECNRSNVEYCKLGLDAVHFGG